MEEEIKEEVLDSPLVVHKQSDASYQEDTSSTGMQTTHVDDDSDAPTLERHRFKKEKKKKKWPYFVLAVVVAAFVIIAVLISNGTISFDKKETTEAPEKSYTTQQVNPFENTITVKGAYVFFEGKEVDGITGLEREIKYLNEGTTFIVQDENANSDFLNFEVLALLSQYKMKYEITHIVSSGLMSSYETTAAPETSVPQTEATTAAPTESTTGQASQ